MLDGFVMVTQRLVFFLAFTVFVNLVLIFFFLGLMLLLDGVEPHLPPWKLLEVTNNMLSNLQVKGMLTDFEDDMHCQFLEILRSLLDSYASGSQVLCL